MATTHPASAFELGKRVSFTHKKTKEKINAEVKKIIGGENDLVLVVPENGPEKGEDFKVRAERLTKLRGPKPGSTRAPKVEESDESDVSDDTETQTSGNDLLTKESAEEMIEACREVIARLQGHIKAMAKPQAKPAKSGIIGRRKAMAEDSDED